MLPSTITSKQLHHPMFIPKTNINTLGLLCLLISCGLLMSESSAVTRDIVFLLSETRLNTAFTKTRAVKLLHLPPRKHVNKRIETRVTRLQQQQRVQDIRVITPLATRFYNHNVEGVW